MNLKELMKESLEYTLRDWKMLILVGILLTLASTIEEIHITHETLAIIFLILSLLLLLIEEGYRAKIIETTLHGNNMPPNLLKNPKGLIKGGFYEVIILVGYFSIISGIIYLHTLYVGFNGSIYNLNFIITVTLLSIFCTIFLICFLIAPINKAINDDKLIHAFKIHDLLKLYHKMGLSNAICSIILGITGFNLVVAPILNWGILDTYKFFEFLISFLLSPLILLFTTRFLSLSVKEVADKEIKTIND